MTARPSRSRMKPNLLVGFHDAIFPWKPATICLPLRFLGAALASMVVERTARGRADAKAKGVRFGRKPKLTMHQQREARERIEAGETQRSVARSYNVSQATISRLAA
jgi:hypothetical protein